MSHLGPICPLRRCSHVRLLRPPFQRRIQIMPPSGPLTGQKALVTGANSGIGQGVALKLGKAGADVVVNYVEGDDAANRVVDQIRASGAKSFAYKADISSENDVAGMFDRAVKEFGTVDILVNNAGLQRDSAFQDMTLDEWNKVLSVNLTGQFLCARAAIREFLRRGVVPSVSRAAGKIICMSSVHQVIPWGGHANYATSKGGIKLLMESMAQELAPKHIRVNAIAPGAIKTPINTAAWNTPEALKGLLTLIPYGRIGEPEDIARAAVWLASDDSDYVVGTTLFVDGGMTLYPGFSTGG
jgi:glucose 1-dehydrogenase